MNWFRRSAVGSFIYRYLPTPAIRWIILSCVVVWLVELFTYQRAPAVWNLLALSKPIPWAWQLLTYQFLHDPRGIVHVLLNMVFLWMLGRQLEARWGSWSFLAFYLTCGVGAGICHVVLSQFVLPSQRAVVMGASGAVMGVMVAFAVIWPRATFLVALVIPMQARHAVILFTLFELWAVWNPNNGVANLAHLGGMATGFIYVTQGWRIAGWFRLGALRARLDEWRKARRRSKMKVVEKEWDSWLRDELDDETRH